jgi:hypothetical protein
MGENARYNGQLVKIGTCEDMYYLRADQTWQVSPVSGSLDPRDPEVQKEIRFRFPWPDEDGTAPGAFKDYDKAVAVHGVELPEGLEHHTVQFSAHAGYLLSLPCPEGPSAHGLQIHRNGFAGPVRIVQQAYRAGVLAVICQCGGCGARYNVPTLAEAQPIIEACEREAGYRAEGPGGWWRMIAKRIAEGYGTDSGCSCGNADKGAPGHDAHVA